MKEIIRRMLAMRDLKSRTDKQPKPDVFNSVETFLIHFPLKAFSYFEAITYLMHERFSLNLLIMSHVMGESLTSLEHVTLIELFNAAGGGETTAWNGEVFCLRCIIQLNVFSQRQYKRCRQAEQDDFR